VAPQSRIDSDMLLRRALPAAHFDRNATTPVTNLVHQCRATAANSAQFRASILEVSSKISEKRASARGIFVSAPA
jgi:hypothetical protein